jgi:hypothetical protein
MFVRTGLQAGTRRLEPGASVPYFLRSLFYTEQFKKKVTLSHVYNEVTRRLAARNTFPRQLQTLRVFLTIVAYLAIVGSRVTSLQTHESVTFFLNCPVFSCSLCNVNVRYCCDLWTLVRGVLNNFARITLLGSYDWMRAPYWYVTTFKYQMNTAWMESVLFAHYTWAHARFPWIVLI